MKKHLLTLSVVLFSMLGLSAQTCQIGNVKYNSLEEAILAVPTNGTQVVITMIANETVAKYHYIKAGQNVVLDLNSKCLTTNGYLNTEANSSLTIRDNGGAGCILSQQWIPIVNKGFTRIEGGSITYSQNAQDKSRVLIYNGSKMEITGGTFKLSDFTDNMVYNSGELSISGGVFTNDSQYSTVANYGTLNISGGEFRHLASGDNKTDSRVVWSWTDTYTTITGGTFIGNGAGPCMYFNGTTEISNATVEATNKEEGFILGVGNGAHVTINSGTYTCDNQKYCGISVDGEGSVLTINGGYFENKGKWNVLYVYPGSSAYIVGGTLVSNSTYAANNAYTIANYGYVFLGSFVNSPTIQNVGGRNGCVYTGSGAETMVLDGKFYSSTKANFGGETKLYSIYSGLFSNINAYKGLTYGYLGENPDLSTRDEYPTYVEMLPVKYKDKVWLRNVKTGKFLGAGDGTFRFSHTIAQDYGLCFNMFDVAGGKYTAFMPKVCWATSYYYLNYQADDEFLTPQYGFLGHDPKSTYDRKYVWTDRPMCTSIFTKEEVRPGVYALYMKDTGYMGESDGVINNNFADASDEAAQWEIITYEELMGNLSNATLDNPVDITQFVSNSEFQNYYNRASITGEETEPLCYYWDGPWHTSSNFITPYNDGTNIWFHWGVNAHKFDVSQTIANLPNGSYILSCQGFYRNASTGSAVATKHKNGTESLNVKFYANDAEMPIKSIIDGATEERLSAGTYKSTYGYIPSADQAVHVYFANERYTNALIVKVTDGTLTFGFKNEEKPVTGEWTAIDKVRLTYYGDAPGTYDYLITAIDDIAEGGSTSVSMPAAYYNLNGMLMQGKAKGLNFIRMSDGTIRKVLIEN